MRFTYDNKTSPSVSYILYKDCTNALSSLSPTSISEYVDNCEIHASKMFAGNLALKTTDVKILIGTVLGHCSAFQ